MGGLAFWFLMVSCEGSAAPKEEGPKVNTLLGDASGVAFEGNWTSPGCQSRSYARNIRFEADHSYAGLDLVSPCPPGTACVWSGMVAFTGFWSIKDSKELILKELGGGGPGSPHPTLFTADMEGNLVEGGCKYQRGLTVPAGYREDQVVPQVPKAPTVTPEPEPAPSMEPNATPASAPLVPVTPPAPGSSPYKP